MFFLPKVLRMLLLRPACTDISVHWYVRGMGGKKTPPGFNASEGFGKVAIKAGAHRCAHP